jgi:hypothetical protein
MYEIEMQVEVSPNHTKGRNIQNIRTEGIDIKKNKTIDASQKTKDWLLEEKKEDKNYQCQ